ncbi:MAG: hypothetical protein KGS48_18850 [Bacteroidetes bacterium]|nr:hypothetical protein [Bacteroidota bacterium]
MRKYSLLEIVVALAVVGGALYFVFFTERGRNWIERAMQQTFDSIDALLASVEKAMSGQEAPQESAEPLDDPLV